MPNPELQELKQNGVTKTNTSVIVCSEDLQEFLTLLSKDLTPIVLHTELHKWLVTF